jgi:hypothetical protein
MSHSVPEHLQDLKTELHHLEVLPAAAIRARGRNRGRRQLVALTAAGAVVATVGISFAWPHQGTAPTTGGSAAGSGVNCVLALPENPSQVQVRVLDTGLPSGVVDEMVTQLRARNFTVLDSVTVHQDKSVLGLRYGPAAIGAATLLRAALEGEVLMRFDPDRRDEIIDMTLGPTYWRIASPTELNQNLAGAGVPSLPPECSRTPGR